MSRKLTPEWLLRIGIAVMYLYSGSSLIRTPEDWEWALPRWLREVIAKIIPVHIYLQLQGVAELLIAIVLLAWFLKPGFVKWFALLSALEMAAILALSFLAIGTSASELSVTFRDFGLLSGASALFLLLVDREHDIAPHE
jgi:hypothetical protein